MNKKKIIQSPFVVMGCMTTILTAGLMGPNAMGLMAPSRVLPASAFHATNDAQEVQILTTGLGSLEKRLQMIADAKSSIDMEFFIYQTDQSGRIMTQALLEKAKEMKAKGKPFSIRLLVDSKPSVFQTNLNAYYAQELAKYGIEVRYYNNISWLQVTAAQNRSHRKTFVIDGKEAIVGGRNIADEYFNLSTTYNFMDRDVYLKGSLVSSIVKSFESFWDSNRTSTLPEIHEPQLKDYKLTVSDVENKDLMPADDKKVVNAYLNDVQEYKDGLAAAKDLLKENSADRGVIEKVHHIGQQQLTEDPSGVCNESYFFADMPGSGEDKRVVFDQFLKLSATAKKQIIIESPYTVLTGSKPIFASIVEKQKIDVQILTNSLLSTDQISTVAAFLPTVEALTSSGVRVFIADGTSPKWQKFLSPAVAQTKWGTHAKGAVIDDDTFEISTFNMDPRSQNLNSEMAFVCRGNKELTAAVREDMMKRQKQMVELDKTGHPKDGRSKYFGVSQGKQFFVHLAAPLAKIFDFWL